jgi:hypothetical protein
MRRLCLLALPLSLACSPSPASDEGAATTTEESGTETETGDELVMCGGPDALTCPEDTYCDDKACGLTGALAECLPIPTDCDPGERPVCGCDGELHESPCAAIQATGQSWCWDEEECGFDISSQITCDTPAGTFACGNVFCDVATEFCDRYVCLAGTQISTCAPLPEACPEPATCECVEATKRFGECTVGAEGGITFELSEGPDGC